MGKCIEQVTTWRCDVCNASRRRDICPADWRVVGFQARKSHAVMDVLFCKDCKQKLADAFKPLLSEVSQDLMRDSSDKED